jgi:Resolvase, N terminal domain
MSHAAAILPHHLNRMAMVYVRQSTPKQLVVHQESTRRQYQLAERAATLGWPQPRIVVLDEDLGRSGASSEARLGFQRLVSAIGLGEVGLVLVTEVSRLSRLNSDWHRVLELCAVFDDSLMAPSCSIPMNRCNGPCAPSSSALRGFKMHGPFSAPFRLKGCSCPASSRMGRTRGIWSG